MVLETIRNYQAGNESNMYEALVQSNHNYQLFRNLPLVEEMTDHPIQELFGCMQEYAFEKGHVFYTGGTTSDRVIHLIIDGKVDAIDPYQEGFTQLSAGDVFGVLSFLDGNRSHAATLKAASDGVVLKLDRYVFDLITLEDPKLGNQLLFFMFRLLTMTSLKLESEYASMHHFALGRRK